MNTSPNRPPKKEEPSPQVPSSREVVSRFVVSEKDTLLKALTLQFPSWSRNTIKQKLRDRCISISGVATSQFDAPLEPNDEVIIYARGEAPRLNHPLVQEVYMDDAFIVLYKLAGIPTVAVNKDAQKTLFRVVANHLKSFNPREKVFLLNRLDKETSGFVVMARNRDLQQSLIENWSDFMLENRFLAIVKGQMPQDAGELERKSSEKKGLSKRKKGEKDTSPSFRASYQVLQETPFTQKIELSLHSRNNAIRSFLAQQENPVVGDERADSWKAPILGLAGISMVFWHPLKKKRVSFEQAPTKAFENLLFVKVTRREKDSFFKQNTEKPIK